MSFFISHRFHIVSLLERKRNGLLEKQYWWVSIEILRRTKTFLRLDHFQFMELRIKICSWNCFNGLSPEYSIQWLLFRGFCSENNLQSFFCIGSSHWKPMRRNAKSANCGNCEKGNLRESLDYWESTSKCHPPSSRIWNSAKLLEDDRSQTSNSTNSQNSIKNFPENAIRNGKITNIYTQTNNTVGGKLQNENDSLCQQSEPLSLVLWATCGVDLMNTNLQRMMFVRMNKKSNTAFGHWLVDRAFDVASILDRIDEDDDRPRMNGMFWLWCNCDWLITFVH